MASIISSITSSGTSNGMDGIAASNTIGSSGSTSVSVNEGPYYTSLQSTPSRQTGMSLDEELRLRRDECTFISRMSTSLRFPMRTTATACVLFHRYYMRHSLSQSHDMVRYERYEVAASALFLACKIEESPRKVGEVAECMQALTMPSDLVYSDDSPQASRLRDTMLACEASLLDATDYCFSFIHPHHIAMLLLRRAYHTIVDHHIGSSSSLSSSSSMSSMPSISMSTMNGSRPMNIDILKEMARTSWTLCNDSLRSPLCLLYRPQAIAIAVVVLVARCHSQTIPFIDAPPTAGGATNNANHSSSSVWWSNIAPQLDERSVHQMVMYIIDNGVSTNIEWLRNDGIIKAWRASSSTSSTSLARMAAPSMNVGAPVMSSASISTAWSGVSPVNDDHLISAISSSSSSSSPYLASVASSTPYIASVSDDYKGKSIAYGSSDPSLLTLPSRHGNNYHDSYRSSHDNGRSSPSSSLHGMTAPSSSAALSSVGAPPPPPPPPSSLSSSSSSHVRSSRSRTRSPGHRRDSRDRHHRSRSRSRTRSRSRDRGSSSSYHSTSYSSSSSSRRRDSSRDRNGGSNRHHSSRDRSRRRSRSRSSSRSRTRRRRSSS